MGWREVVGSGSAGLDRVSALDYSAQVHPKSLSCNTRQSGSKVVRSGGKGHKRMGGQNRTVNQGSLTVHASSMARARGAEKYGWVSFGG